jgi:putative FmdB family regulatory protein
MPTYKFKCEACKESFSIQKPANEIIDKPMPPCIHCGSQKVKRVFSGISVITSKKS